MIPRVLNKRIHGVPEGAVYVGRPAKWGNPFVLGPHGNRETVIQKFADMIHLERRDSEIVRELRGKDLVCWCAPLPCHADVLLEIANSDPKRPKPKPRSK